MVVHFAFKSKYTVSMNGFTAIHVEKSIRFADICIVFKVRSHNISVTFANQSFNSKNRDSRHELILTVNIDCCKN